MKYTCIKNVGLALLVTAGMIGCNDAATTAEKKDSMGTTTDPMTTEPAANENKTEQSDDGKLVTELIESMNGGIALMQQGQTKATAQPVKDLAKKLETEHTKLTDDLKALAIKKGYTVPTSASADDTKMKDDMADDDVADYQKEWLSALKDKHETNIRKIEDSKTTDPDLQALAAKGLPKLRELLNNIKTVQDNMK